MLANCYGATMAGRLLIAVLFAGCVSEGVAGPDAGLPDAGAADVRVPQDAAPDSVVDADACWGHEIVQCGNTLIDLCVPRMGCATYQCDGQWYGYCGPG